MNKFWRKLDNTAKIFSVEDNYNTFRLAIILKENVDPDILKKAVCKTLEVYSSYKVKIKTGFFWNYLEVNSKEIIIEEENVFKKIDFKKNNDYLFKVSYFNNRINLDVFHVLTDGMGAITFLKAILYHYLNLKYHLETKELIENIKLTQDENLKNADKKLICKEKYKKAFLIRETSNYSNNKTYHYILNLEKSKKICKEKNVSITEYLTALYIYSIYKTVYDKASNKDVVVTVPIDLRSYYNVKTLSNFFTCMSIEGDLINKKNISFDEVLSQVHKEFKNKLVPLNVKKYLSRDVKLGMNIGIRLIPLFIKKFFMKYFGKLVNQSSTTTLSNIGSIKIEEQYTKYVDNIVALVNTGKIQKIKCTICSYENDLTVTLNSNLVDKNIEEEFYRLLIDYVGDVKIKKY